MRSIGRRVREDCRLIAFQKFAAAPASRRMVVPEPPQLMLVFWRCQRRFFVNNGMSVRVVQSEFQRSHALTVCMQSALGRNPRRFACRSNF